MIGSNMIDSHQHFWQLERGDYAWLKQEPKVLQQNYLPAHLLPLLQQTKVCGTVLVQAEESLDETLFLLDLAQQNDFILGVVGWLDFDSDRVFDELDKLHQKPKFIGLRPVLQGIAQDDWILAPHRLEVVRKLADLNLSFDALVEPRHLPVLAQLLQQVPGLRLVIDHGAKPQDCYWAD